MLTLQVRWTMWVWRGCKIIGNTTAAPTRKNFCSTLSLVQTIICRHPTFPPRTASPTKPPGTWPTPPTPPLATRPRAVPLQVALKVADIGHLSGELGVHKRWLGVLEEEFFRQGDRERALGLPISPLFDRAKQGVSKSQVGFFDFVALPLVRAFAAAFPGAQPMAACFEANYGHWVEEQAQAQQQEEAQQQGGGKQEQQRGKQGQQQAQS